MSAGTDLVRDTFRRQVQDTLLWLGQTEGLWLSSLPGTSIRSSLTTLQLAALYEAAYLRIFASWEVFLEDICAKFMAGQATSYVPRAAAGQRLERTVKAARMKLFGTKDYLLWHNPVTVQLRVARWLSNSPIEIVFLRDANWLGNAASVRHAIAHGSADAIANFELACVAITGSRKDSPGRMLRASDLSDPLNLTKWIVIITGTLVRLADEIAA